ncbi:MAG: ABC transporter ATP-binding protein [Planctomycetota bacterium]
MTEKADTTHANDEAAADAAPASDPAAEPAPAPAVATPAAAIPAVAPTADTSDRVVETKDLVKTFRSRSLAHGSFWQRAARLFVGKPVDVHAVKTLNIHIRRGEVFGLLGPNGSGKSTTIKMLLGLLVPTSGSITLLGEPPDKVAVKSRIGFLPEESYLYRFLSSEETLDFYARLFGMGKAERKQRADELIKLVGLEHARNRPTKEYSKGMARRIGLAQALINDPELVILDEPTSGLDPIGTAEIKHVIKQLKAQGKTVLLCSHLLADVEEVCDRVAIMCNGELLAMGALSELLQMRDRLDVQFDKSDDAFRQRVEAFAKAEGVDIVAARNASDSLARLFLRLIEQQDPGRIPAVLRDELILGKVDGGA